MNINHRLEPAKKIPKKLAIFSELSRLISENNIKLFSHDENSKLDMLNYHIEQNQSDSAFFVIDLGEILEQYKNWKTLLPRVQPFYAVRACSDPMVLKTLAVLGCNFSCATKAEIIKVTDLDVPASRILYGNPIKDSQYMRFAKSQDLETLVFDNETELYKIKLYHPYAKLIIRINIEGSATNKYMTTNKYGCTLSDAKILLEKARFLELNVVGVSFSVNHKRNDPDNYATGISQAREVFDTAQSLGITMNILDIGGGFPAGNSQASSRFEDIAKTINESLNKHFGNVEGLRIIAEPGRYFCTKSHTLMFNVIGMRKIKDEDQQTQFQYYMNDGVYGSFNCIVFDGADPEIRPVNNNRNGKKYMSTLFGPTCDDMDVITRSIEIPELGLGEWCYVEDFGAYTQNVASDENGLEPNEFSYIFMY